MECKITNDDTYKKPFADKNYKRLQSAQLYEKNIQSFPQAGGTGRFRTVQDDEIQFEGFGPWDEKV